VHWCDEEPEYSMYFVREATDIEFQQLEENKITLRDFLQTSDPLYIVRDWHKRDTEIEVFIIEAGDYLNYFPLQGIYLTLEKENEFSSEDG
jgi:NDP-sugar pyrophosphorylase family protein